MSEGAAGRSLLCRVEARLCALPLSDVVETMRPLPVQAFADMPRFVRGLAIIRGTPTPVLDLARLLGLAAAAEPARFVTVKAGPHRVALAVDEVIGVADLSRTPLADLPPLLGGAAAEVVATVGTLDAELLAVLRGARSVPEGVWGAGGEGAAG